MDKFSYLPDYQSPQNVNDELARGGLWENSPSGNELVTTEFLKVEEKTTPSSSFELKNFILPKNVGTYLDSVKG